MSQHMAEAKDAVADDLRAQRRQQLARAAAHLHHWLRSGPVSDILAVLLVLIFVASSCFDRAVWEADIASGIGQGWWTIFTAFLWVQNLGSLIVDIIALLTVGIWLERSLGSQWFATIGIVTYSVGVILTILSVKLIEIVDSPWAEMLKQQKIVGVLAF